MTFARPIESARSARPCADLAPATRAHRRAAGSVAVGSEKPTASERCCVETIIDALVDLPSPALKARLAATESALVAAKSEREEAATLNGPPRRPTTPCKCCISFTGKWSIRKWRSVRRFHLHPQAKVFFGTIEWGRAFLSGLPPSTKQKALRHQSDTKAPRKRGGEIPDSSNREARIY